MSWVYGGKNFRVTPQTVWALKLCTIAKAWSLLAKSKLSQKKFLTILLCVWDYFFVCLFCFIFPFLSPSLRLAYSQASPQTTCNHLSGSHFGSKLTHCNLSLAQGSAFQSISQGRHENTHFSVFLWLPAHLSQLINVSQPVRTSRVCSGTSEPKWRHEGQSGSSCC